MSARLLAALEERGWTLAVAESLTGGMVAAAIVDTPGASLVFRGGVVSYATAAKESVLGVDAGVLERLGAVSREVAVQMATGVRELFSDAEHTTEVGLATTGVAGPESQDGKPVGTVWVAVSLGDGVFTKELFLDGARNEIRTAAAQQALAFTLSVVIGTG